MVQLEQDNARPEIVHKIDKKKQYKNPKSSQTHQKGGKRNLKGQN